MAISRWAPIQNRNGVDQVSPPLEVTPGSTRVYARLAIDNQSHFDDAQGAGQILRFSTWWSADTTVPPADSSFQHLGGNGDGWQGGSAPVSKDGFYSTEENLPPGCRYVRANYSVVNGPIRFGVDGEFRT